MTLDLCVAYRKTGKADGIDWNYVTTDTCTFTFDRSPAEAWIPVQQFSNRWLSITVTAATVTVTIAKAYAFDGCSVVPDFDGTVAASLPHDAIYQFVDEIAQAWGCKVSTVLTFADLRFKDVMIYNHVPPALYKTYYAGVAVFGWLFNRGNKLWGKITGK